MGNPCETSSPPSSPPLSALPTQRTLRGRGPDRPSGGFRPDIEGLRAVAVLLVVLGHAGLRFVPGGYVGVDVFFVISGFLITSLLVREVETTGRLSIPPVLRPPGRPRCCPPPSWSWSPP